ncbi:MAG: hypothetical protein OSA51_14395 [Octadecabacter sp.]|nr:hypothetical protein [Octadecabacter sp.]
MVTGKLSSAQIGSVQLFQPKKEAKIGSQILNKMTKPGRAKFEVVA